MYTDCNAELFWKELPGEGFFPRGATTLHMITTHEVSSPVSTSVVVMAALNAAVSAGSITFLTIDMRENTEVWYPTPEFGDFWADVGAALCKMQQLRSLKLRASRAKNVAVRVPDSITSLECDGFVPIPPTGRAFKNLTNLALPWIGALPLDGSYAVRFSAVTHLTMHGIPQLSFPKGVSELLSLLPCLRVLDVDGAYTPSLDSLANTPRPVQILSQWSGSEGEKLVRQTVAQARMRRPLVSLRSLCMRLVVADLSNPDCEHLTKLPPQLVGEIEGLLHPSVRQ